MVGQVGCYQQVKGNGQYDGEQGIECSNVQGFDQFGLDVVVEVGLVDGLYVGEYVVYLFGCIVEEFGDDFDVVQ